MLVKDYKKRKYAKDILKNPWFKNAPKKIIESDIMKESLNNLQSFSAT